MSLHSLTRAAVVAVTGCYVSLVVASALASEAVPTADNRRAIPLAPAEQAFVRAEMRDFLAAVQAITSALERGDYKAVAQAARARGMAATHDVPPALRAKLPMEFRQLGNTVHRGFDQIAMDAEAIEDTPLALKQMGELLGNCVGCHAVFRLGP